MLSSLKFTQGAVSRKDLLPSLTHFKISDNKIKSFNGTIALCSPIPLDIECLPKAIPLVKAIQNCHEAVSISLLKNGKLKINSGVFSASIECTTEEGLFPEPEGEEIEINGKALIDALRVLAPFLSNDASRQWANGILFKGQSAFVTNNLIMIEYWVGSVFPKVCNIPSMAVKELLRIEEVPHKIQYNDRTMTFHYSEGRWLKTAQYSVDWPDINRVLDVNTNPKIISPDLFEGLEKLRPFADELKRVYLDGNMMATSLDEDAGARFNLSSEYPKSVFNLNMLDSLKDVAKQMDFSLFPRPCLFYGERLRGAIAPLKLE
jgi:DNA polymerase III sliding clamp (beta) subunit (PCNA family)